ncbi:MAG: DUF4469 domain-containing protein [Treponema sp.]|jgi:hypothetical protein|nr:DUF4469 domain-containing protein [Treponema sp.]
MAIIKSARGVLHRIRVKLYPNYLANVEGAYIARTDSEASLSIEEVCAALKIRGGFTGNYDDLVDHVKQFFDEAAYQLCDGFAVNTRYFSIYPNVGGTFDDAVQGCGARDVRKHPVTFRFRARAPLRALASHIAVEIEGMADVSGYIGKLLDISAESVNDALTPGGIFIITGHKIKITGKNPDIGVYFVSAQDAGARVKASGRLAENTASKVVGIVPALDAGAWKVAIKTQFSGYGSKGLKEPRVIESEFTVTVPEAGA